MTKSYSTPSFAPIPTQFHGCLFRSRLEARWAVAFDAIGLRWEYEPQGYTLPNGECYLPDFWFPQIAMWGEVKPAGPDPFRFELPFAAIQKAAALAVGSHHPIVFLDGPPAPVNYWAIWPDLDPLDPIGWDWEDVYLWGQDYHLTEHRLYASTGALWPDRHAPFAGDERHPAIIAARLASFGGRAA